MMHTYTFTLLELRGQDNRVRQAPEWMSLNLHTYTTMMLRSDAN